MERMNSCFVENYLHSVAMFAVLRLTIMSVTIHLKPNKPLFAFLGRRTLIDAQSTLTQRRQVAGSSSNRSIIGSD